MWVPNPLPQPLIFDLIDYIQSISSDPEQFMPSKITSKQMIEILKLEQLFYHKYLTADFLHELIALYVKAIENFDHDFIFMREYFLSKMQFLLSRPQIVAILGRDEKAMDNIRETLAVRDRDEENERQSTPLQMNRVEKHDHHHYYYDESKSQERNMKIDMKVKIMREVEENMKILKQEVNEQAKKQEKKDLMVKNITKNQDDQLKMRRAMRKNKLRKKSIEIKARPVEGQQQEPEPEPIKKEELLDDQRKLTERILHFTIRMTEKAKQESDKREATKGRVKLKKAENIDEANEQEQATENKVNPKNGGRIKTRRIEEVAEDSQYW